MTAAIPGSAVTGVRRVGALGRRRDDLQRAGGAWAEGVRDLVVADAGGVTGGTTLIDGMPVRSPTIGAARISRIARAAPPSASG